jgi:hypothetical protein
MATKSHTSLRKPGPLGRLRARLSESLYRAQLGPSREAEANDFSPRRPWHNHRSF